MKNYLLIIMACCLSSQVLAQVSATEVINKIQSGEDVTYENVTIEGVVDLTPYQEEKDDLPKKSWFGDWDDAIDNTMRGQITFINCQFEDDFLAYYHDDRSEVTFVTHFDKAVTFRNCTFRRDAAFKYSEFREAVDFSGSTFKDDANYKYAEFHEESTFSKAVFEEDADFKYTEFERMADFSGSRFQEQANFKYSEMEDGVSFKNVVFDGLWNIKYAEMDKDVDLAGIEINDDLDSKYTKINGRSFNHYLLSNK